MVDYFSRLFQRFREERFAQLAASLSFATLLSIVPLVAVVILIGNKIPWIGGVVGYLDNFIIDNLLPEQTGDVVARYAYRFSRQANRLTLGGAVLLLGASGALIFSIERAFNHLWRVTVRRSFASRLGLYVGAIAVFPLFAGAVLGATGTLVRYATPMATGNDGVTYVIVHGSAGLLLCGMFSLLYFAIPAAPVRLRGAIAGGAVAAMGIMAAQRLFGMAMNQASIYKTIYGAFSALPVFLVWLYLSWAIVLVGALVAANFSPPPAPRRKARRSP